MRQERLDDFTTTVDQLNHASGKAGLDQQLDDAGRGHRHALGRLEDESVACGDGEGIHPERDHRGEIEGRDAGADADGLANGAAVDSFRDIVERIAHHERRHAAGDFDHLDAALDLGYRVFEDLAVLAGEDGRNFEDIFLEQGLEAIERLHTIDHRHFAPLEPGAMRVLRGAIHIGGSGIRQDRQRLTIGGVDDGLRGLAFGRNPAAGDVRRSDRDVFRFGNNSAHASSPASSGAGDRTTAPRINTV